MEAFGRARARVLLTKLHCDKITNDTYSLAVVLMMIFTANFILIIQTIARRNLFLLLWN